MNIEEKIETLQKEVDRIRDGSKMWETCTDGSYEVSLYYAGYYVKLAELRILQGIGDDIDARIVNGEPIIR